MSLSKRSHLPMRQRRPHQMTNLLLSDVKVLDLTHRLPGPLAGKLLADLGAQVTKIEDQTFGDPFNSSIFDAMDDSFKSWYQKLNTQKSIISLDYKKSQDQERFVTLYQQADIVLMGLPSKIQRLLNLVDQDHIHACVHMVASLERKESMHDLNVLAKLGYLSRHVQEFKDDEIIPPPFFPVAGMAFSHTIVQNAQAALYQAEKQKKRIDVTVSLEQATKDLFEPLHMTEQSSFLHNGRYPCYNIYRLKDGFIALACLEEKFWQRLCETFNLEFSLEDRFHDQDLKVKNELAHYFKPLSKESVLSLMNGQDMCVSVFS
jgi:alpha-methylacyl-CoA racemase